VKIQRQKTNPPQRHGVFLMELLAQLVIMAVVGLLVGQLVLLLVRGARATAERDTMIARVDSALDVMRRDAWNARGFRPTGDAVEMDLTDGTVTWKAEPGGLSRVAMGQTRSWTGMPRMQFSASPKPAMLIIAVDSGIGGSKKRETLTLASQRLLAGGAP
jgi:Tfp pilus assembly protein PilW